ncbi:cation-translocating P-type ATPase [Bacillus sp. S/N-304-OC-R1]|uniref:heavy metal translocating P-type ATPase n=1 Tax=Bacillus sp. S/N-304-OC-R1 TaxID=2758034 RepID=UPI001C8E88A2|nr:heavy metal translocating P-type ATPase [Bacillus sp. S/N-304-OC-R1]MBY0121297.1 copper-translocating P-type ATPase [Bacillus sp. S/N-304-OC-R1]
MIETAHIEVKGMHCAACTTRIEKSVSKIDGVTDIMVNLTTEKGRVSYEKNRTSVSEIIQRINKIGFEAKEISKNNLSDRNKYKEIRRLQWKFILSALLTLPMAWAMFAHFHWASFVRVPELFVHPLFQFALTIPIQFFIGAEFYDRAWKAIRNRSANMDVLVVLSTSAAFFYSHYLTFTTVKTYNPAQPVDLFYETSAFIITFILLGKLLEAKTKLRTSEAIKKLYQLQMKTATLYVNGKESNIQVEEIVPGDIIVLKPGEKVPIDGQVIDGHSVMDESLLTGESIPVEKSIGHEVYAGTINQNGLLKIRATKRISETALSQIIRIVEEAQASKAPIQYIADHITALFVPIVVVIAAVTFAVWYALFQPGDLREALEKTITVLIIACPCALGLATPTSVMVGSGRAAQLGILFKEGRFLELLGKNKIIVFDKTGTITKGEPQVTDIYSELLNIEAFLEVIGAVENTSDHPIAKAIVQRAIIDIPIFPSVSQVLSMPGYGVKATVGNQKIIIASPVYYKRKDILIPSKAADLVTKLEQEGKSVMIAFIDSRFAGIIAVADEIKSTSVEAVSRLKGLGLEVIMLTGDNRNTAMAVGKKVGIHKLRAEVMPQQKAEIIQSMQQKGNKIIMVGDGINDAPALAVAHVGIALGTGSDVAIESADMTIMKDDLNRVVDAILISRKTMTNIKQNFLWAFLYNIMMIPLAMLGYLAPWIAAAAMAFSSVSVVLNSLRLKKIKL